jgi:hypothetical protein
MRHEVDEKANVRDARDCGSRCQHRRSLARPRCPARDAGLHGRTPLRLGRDYGYPNDRG